MKGGELRYVCLKCLGVQSYGWSSELLVGVGIICKDNFQDSNKWTFKSTTQLRPKPDQIFIVMIINCRVKYIGTRLKSLINLENIFCFGGI